MRLYIGSDHAGYKLKENLKKWLEKKNIKYEDLGANSLDSKDDYPDYAKKVAKVVAKDKNAKGILICGSGIGIAMAANKVKGIRAVPAHDAYSAKVSRADNDSNILCLRGRNFPLKTNLNITNIWPNTPFSAKARHKRRITKLNRM